MSKDQIRIKGATQNNLKDVSIDLPLGELIVISGVSGSGKSSLAFDTIYAEGQRRYVETFSPYARQFLERMDKPSVSKIEGIPPAIAIDQTNPVRTSRSTVGTMTELNDHLKLLFARAASLYCYKCGQKIERDLPNAIINRLLAEITDNSRALVTFRIQIPSNFSENEVEYFLRKQGYTRIHKRRGSSFEVIQDRVRLSQQNYSRLIEDLDAAFHHGSGYATVHIVSDKNLILRTKKFSKHLHCASCDISYRTATPNTFSFNSPVGACETCRGFGRTIGIDYALVIPNEQLSLKDGAIRPWQTKSYSGWQSDLLKYAKKRKISITKSWKDLSRDQRVWVIDGEGSFRSKKWYGVRRFFDWLESKSYKMHIRILLSKYRAYDTCSSCDGARLKTEAMNWRLGEHLRKTRFLRFANRPTHALWISTKENQVDGLTIHDLLLMPINEVHSFFEVFKLPSPLDEATDLLLREIRSRLAFLMEVGLRYLTLDRQSRTLSGGEVQRINLTTALGTSLVNTLFVLDEPSVGLHPRDIQKVIGVLKRLRNAGNSLLVVEHDEQIMRHADRIIDIGPGPGSNGGEVVFFGTPEQILHSKQSITGDYLSGKRQVISTEVIPTSESDPHIKIYGASENNLKSIDISIPLQRLTCITGVSGSGKSTLVRNVLFNGLAKLKGNPQETAGKFKAIVGGELVEEIIFVDQAPIGKTTRSNPATYVGAFDAIRSLFAREPLAIERNYTTGTFSFNTGTGRCPTCAGSGFEHVEMQFLSDAYLRCADCNGRRFRSETCDIKYHSASQALSIADVLDLTIDDAIVFFSEQKNIKQALRPLISVGLGYLTLGQPVTTLSGGESQRLKLAGFLSKFSKAFKRPSTEKPMGSLFIFDEPTTGLHQDDINKLVLTFRTLIEQTHSVLVVEHQLDLINTADHIIDLGPDGGVAGGQVVATGTPDHIATSTHSATGQMLKKHRQKKNQHKKKTVVQNDQRETKAIFVQNAKEHNLKNIQLRIPHTGFTVVTGVSGSGKSTVAFDILFAEGQRRYLASLNAYARQFIQPASRPDVDAIWGIRPTVAIEQRTSRGGRKSTVATLSEVYHFLRLLFVKLGQQFCPDCSVSIEPQTFDNIVATTYKLFRSKPIQLLAPMVVWRKGYYTDLAKWAEKQGFDYLRVDGNMTPTHSWPRLNRFQEHNIDLPVGGLQLDLKKEEIFRNLLMHALKYGDGLVRIAGPANETLFSLKRACPNCDRSFDELDPRLFSYNSKHGWCPTCFGTGQKIADFDGDQTGEESLWIKGVLESTECPTCNGSRLKPEALAVFFQGRNINSFGRMTIAEAHHEFQNIKLTGRKAEIAADILAELKTRLDFLDMVGLSYLTLDRPAPSLSGGEAQRIRLAAQLGSNLRGVCYILDEPTIGLHTHDTHKLIRILRTLEKKGNTVVVVEHDEETIRQADHIIDLGPRAGVDGGHVVATGTISDIIKNKKSVTGKYLAKSRQPLVTCRRVNKSTPGISIHHATLNNLQGVNVTLPLERFVSVTGVSGSGKSTLVRSILYKNMVRRLQQQIDNKHYKPTNCKAFSGGEAIHRILEVNQTPIGKTPRSCPATYVGFWSSIRQLFHETTEANIRGYGPERFSFNVKGGRCEICDGQGIRKIEMNFLPDVRVTCEGCAGTRFNQETLEVRYRGKNIGEILAMNVDSAAEFFKSNRKISHSLKLLQDVGLGYLTLGQQSPTLSGGEAQRIKLVTELSKAKPTNTLKQKSQATIYLLDEPTIGLHMADVEQLIHVLHRLVDAGNSVVVIEHNLDVLAASDWIIDLGPEGGSGGGKIIAKGAPKTLINGNHKSHTVNALKLHLKNKERTQISL